MSGYNSITLLGNLTRDPELRYTAAGVPIAQFGLAVNRKYTSNGEQKESVLFVDVVSFGRQAEHIGQYIHKGSKVLVVGRLELQQWETQDGQKRSKHEVHCQTCQFLDSRRSTEAATQEDYEY